MEGYRRGLRSMMGGWALNPLTGTWRVGASSVLVVGEDFGENTGKVMF